jgi:hypothetical protein
MQLAALSATLDDADDACHRGDLPALAELARLLIATAPHELRFELVAVAELAALNEPVGDRWRRLALLLRDGELADAALRHRRALRRWTTRAPRVDTATTC